MRILRQFTATTIWSIIAFFGVMVIGFAATNRFDHVEMNTGNQGAYPLLTTNSTLNADKLGTGTIPSARYGNSTIAPSALDSSGAAVGQVPTFTGGTVEWQTQSGGVTTESDPIWAADKPTYDAHLTNTANPHGVTALQLGAVTTNGTQVITGLKTFSVWPRGPNGVPTVANELATKYYVDSAISGLDWQEAVLDKDVDAPPVSPTAGDRYIIPTVAYNAWTNQVNNIAEWDGAAWQYTAAADGMAAITTDDSKGWTYSSSITNWVQFSGAGGFAYAGGDGITVSGSDISADIGDGLDISSGQIVVDETELQMSLLSDVTWGTPLDGQVFRYNAATGKGRWESVAYGSGGGSNVTMVTVLGYGSHNWINMPAATNNFVNNPNTIRFDATGKTRARIVTYMNNAAFLGSKISLQCSTNNAVSWFWATTNNLAEVALTNTSTQLVGAYATLDTAARGDVRWRMVGYGGNGAADPTFGFTGIEFVGPAYESPLTTKGDLLGHDGTNHGRLAAGTQGYVLQVDSNETLGVKWALNAGNPTTTKGDLVTHNGTNSIRLGVGTDGYYLTANSATASGVEWVLPSYVTATITNGLIGSVSGPGLTTTGGATTLSTNGWSFGGSGITTLTNDASVAAGTIVGSGSTLGIGTAVMTNWIVTVGMSTNQVVTSGATRAWLGDTIVCGNPLAVTNDYAGGHSFNIPTNGWYNFNCHIWASSVAWTAGQNVSIKLQTNGVDYVYIGAHKAQSTSTYGLPFIGNRKIYLTTSQSPVRLGLVSDVTSSAIAQFDLTWVTFSLDKIGP